MRSGDEGGEDDVVGVWEGGREDLGGGLCAGFVSGHAATVVPSKGPRNVASLVRRLTVR